ncbi:Selenoprotein S, putative [Pediculus humanus corporis]|uniref:Selenoprotein S, putative n=1 Tax=Pediculus humanus subsp. corporis TaxID=121224 RepID=E0VBS6_PEDHC|nr:Selenoprotein S, putative [Pediculus humanus corporis]EEB10832.1 Selenoprotein S, putative [Pediculus humanus corporis]
MDNIEVEEIIAEPNEPSWMTSVSFSILQSNAWYIVAVAALVYYIWNEYLSSKFNKWREEREIKRIAAIAKKEPDNCFELDEARMKAVRKLQDEYNKQACIKQKSFQEKEEKKRQESYSRLGLQGGRKLNDSYFPLSDSSSSSNYVPTTRRKGCPGGC